MLEEKHIHQWKLDRQGNAVCACGATRHYRETYPKLNMQQKTMVSNISFYWPSWDPDSSMCGSLKMEVDY